MSFFDQDLAPYPYGLMGGGSEAVAQHLSCSTPGAIRNCRVLHVIQGLTVGGMENGTLQLAKLSRQHGYDDRIVTYDTAVDPHSAVSALEGVPVVFARRRPGFDWTFAARLRRLLLAWNVRILHAHNDTALFYSALAVAFMGKNHPRLIGTYHNAPTHITWRARFAARCAAQEAAYIVALSSELRDRLRSTGWVKDCHIILNGIDVERYTPNGESGNWRAILNIPAEALVIGNIARFDMNKRQADLVEAVRLLRGMLSRPIALIFVGEGKTLETVRTLAGDDRDMHFLPRVSDVAAFLRSLDIFVLCSLHEGAPRAMLEAMACGCPVVATAVGGIPEILTKNDGLCGYLVPPCDPPALARGIAAVYALQEAQTALCQRARQRVVDSFSAERQWTNYEALYAAALVHRL